MIIKDENVRGGELAEKKGWRRTPVGRGRNQYGTGAGSIRRAAIRGARRTGIQASCTDDVVRQIDGHLAAGRQNSVKSIAHLHRNHRGLAASASRVLDGQTTRSIRVGDSVLYDYVPQGIICVDSHVTSCQGTQDTFLT